MSVVVADLSRRTTTELRRAVEEGGQDELPRGAAIEELARRAYPFKVRSIRKVLVDEQADLAARLLATDAIAGTGGPEARAVLLEAAQSENSRVRREAIFALGRIGEPEDANRLTEYANEERPAASFANLLISFRKRGEARLPEDFEDSLYPPLSDCCALPVTVRPSSAEQVEAGVWALGEEAFGVDPSAEAAFSLDLEGTQWLAAFDCEATQRLAESAKGDVSCVLGLIAEEDSDDPGDYFLFCVLLAERNYKGGRVAGFDFRGRLRLLGTLEGGDDAATVRLRAVAVPEVPPIEIDLELRLDSSVQIRRAEIAPGLTRKVRIAATEG